MNVLGKGVVLGGVLWAWRSKEGARSDVNKTAIHHWGRVACLPGLASVSGRCSAAGADLVELAADGATVGTGAAERVLARGGRETHPLGPHGPSAVVLLGRLVRGCKADVAPNGADVGLFAAMGMISEPRGVASASSGQARL